MLAPGDSWYSDSSSESSDLSISVSENEEEENKELQELKEDNLLPDEALFEKYNVPEALRVSLSTLARRFGSRGEELESVAAESEASDGGVGDAKLIQNDEDDDEQMETLSSLEALARDTEAIDPDDPRIHDVLSLDTLPAIAKKLKSISLEREANHLREFYAAHPGSRPPPPEVKEPQRTMSPDPRLRPRAPVDYRGRVAVPNRESDGQESNNNQRPVAAREPTELELLQEDAELDVGQLLQRYKRANGKKRLPPKEDDSDNDADFKEGDELSQSGSSSEGDSSGGSNASSSPDDSDSQATQQYPPKSSRVGSLYQANVPEYVSDPQVVEMQMEASSKHCGTLVTTEIIDADQRKDRPRYPAVTTYFPSPTFIAIPGRADLVPRAARIALDIEVEQRRRADEDEKLRQAEERRTHLRDRGSLKPVHRVRHLGEAGEEKRAATKNIGYRGSVVNEFPQGFYYRTVMNQVPYAGMALAMPLLEGEDKKAAWSEDFAVSFALQILKARLGDDGSVMSHVAKALKEATSADAPLETKITLPRAFYDQQPPAERPVSTVFLPRTRTTEVQTRETALATFVAYDPSVVMEQVATAEFEPGLVAEVRLRRKQVAAAVAPEPNVPPADHLDASTLAQTVSAMDALGSIPVSEPPTSAAEAIPPLADGEPQKRLRPDDGMDAIVS